MPALLLIAIVIIPLLAERMATRLPGQEKRSAVHYLLVPLMGALVFGTFAVIAGHAYLALAGSCLYYFGLTFISNKKITVLGMGFNAHDFVSARNVAIYPEFYVAYVGWPLLFCIIAAATGIIASSFLLEPWFGFYGVFPFAYGGWAVGLLLWFGGLRLAAAAATRFVNETTREKLGITTDVNADIARFGLFPSLLLYQLLLAEKIDKKSLRERPTTATIKAEKPADISTGIPADIIAIQGESFFDLERFFKHLPAGQQQPWQPLRALEAAGVATGHIRVPCWGAYTQQSEFSFLSQIHNSALGIDRIDPYIRFAQRPVSTVAQALRDAGYRTVCIHPAKRGFFRRDKAMRNMGFDDFIGIEGFAGAAYFGKYISDAALADKIDSLVADHHATSDKPLFVFVITIESHGPWANGRLEAFLPSGISEASLTADNITGDREFALYQTHMDHMMAFYRRLSVDAKLGGTQRIVSLYGDHMPALGPLFTKHGFSDERVDYLLWNSAKPVAPTAEQSIESFAATVLAEADITLSQS